MLWRRPQPAPEFPISHDEVMEIFDALSDIKAWTKDILSILKDEDEDEP
ncbi:MAG: hypothetical protein ACRDON_13175 [Gaiellaceae bacterium]